jgi:glycosyltransferase involved in cell wall biosynthesis
MNILQLNFERGWRGGERQTLLTLQQLRLHGHNPALLARQGSELAQRAHSQGFVVHEFAGVAGALRFLVSQGRSYDVLHAQTANTLSWLVMLKPLLRRPVVFTRRTAFPVKPGKESRTRWKWQRVDAFIAISQAAAQEPQRLGFMPRVIPSAIEPRALNEDHLRLFSQEHDLAGKRVLATVAALTREKDPETLIRAVHELRQMRDDFVFLHLGAGGDAEDSARDLVDQLGLQQHYLFAGFQAGIEDIYRLMDVYVSSSRHEALGTSVLDAFLYGVPVVSTDAGGLAESLADGRGLLCPVGDHAALAAAMNQALSDGALRAGMVERARRYVQQEHDVAVMGERYLAVYQAVAGAGRS